MSAFEEKDYQKNIDLKLLQKLLIFIKPYKKQMIFLGMFMMGLAGVDLLFPLLNRYAIDNFVVPKNIDGLVKFSFLFLALIAIQAVNILFFISLAGKIETGLTYDIRKASFQHLQKLSFDYYDQTPVGWILARLTSDCERLGSIISWGLVDIIWGSTLMFGISIVMLFLNWKLALITLTVVPALVFLSIFFQKKILGAYRYVRKNNSKITASFNEGIAGAKTTKTLVRESENLSEFQQLTGKMYNSSVKAAVFSALFLPIVLTLGSIGTGLALWFGGEGVIVGAITYGTLVAFVSYSVQFFEPLREIARVFAELQNAQASAERIFSLLNQKPKITDSTEVVEKFGAPGSEKIQNWPPIKGDIEFCNIYFSYIEEEPILEDFNLKVKAGQTVALVGETGSGKSTIVNLACRFYEPNTGQILIDGTDYRERSLQWLHSNIGYVLQSPHLFSGTIAENIRYGKLDATLTEIESAAKLVNAHGFIKNMKDGYNSEVGEGGSLLSTGQKQLISFARAVVSDPRIFILDEATSSVDTETELKIQNAITKVLQNRTSFIIAHRLSTIKKADIILVIKNGKVIEKGNHHELIELKGNYFNLYTNQFADEQRI